METTESIPSSLEFAADGMSRAEESGFSDESRGREGSRAGCCAETEEGAGPAAVLSRDKRLARGCMRRGGRTTLCCFGGLENVNTVAVDAPPVLPAPFDAAPPPPPPRRLLRAGAAALTRGELLFPPDVELIAVADEVSPVIGNVAVLSTRNCCLADEDVTCRGPAAPAEFARRRSLRAN